MSIFGSSSEFANWYLATDEGKSLASFTTCLGVSVSMDGQVVQEPIENGSFASYNKTISPITVNATMVKQGEASELSEILETVRNLQTGTDLFSFITPEREFRSMTLETFDYERRREGGINLLTLNLSMKEVKQIDISYTSTELPAKSVKDASAADTQQTGQKSAEEVEPGALYKTMGTIIPSSNSGNTNQGGQ